MFAKALLYRNAPLARLALIVLSLLLALPAVAQQSRALPTAIDNDSPTRTAGTWQWIRAEVDFLEQGQPELLLIPDRDLQLIPENVLSDLIRSEPDLSWLCENPDPRQMRCRAHGPAPFAQQLRFWLPAERLLAADGTRNQALTGHLVTPRPMLMAELVATAESEHPQIELLAPMDLSDDSVSDSLRLLIDGKAASFELRRSAPTYFRPRAWGFNAAADGQTPQPGNWRTEPGFAWNLIPPALRSGQLLELRLHSGLRTDSGPLSNSVNDPEGQLLLRWQAPKSATARVTCGGSARQPEFMDLGAFLGQLPIARDCQANDRLAIFFDTRPSTEAMEALASALPAPLQLDPLGLQLLHSDPASRGTDQVASAALAYRLDLIGAKGGQRYQIRPGANWRDVHGAPIKPEQLRWSTATTGSWDPMIAPERVAFRRQSQSPGGPARSDDNAGQALRIQFGDGESVTQKLPTGVSSANPRVLGLPADRSLWATAIQPRNPSASGYDAPPIAFAVTDLGLHAVIL
ncbi:MAG: hypothetical protein KDI71_11085, partial [Xanthomonadales bacterium]|nr:hypothetical protein [Xanthomonadales bacterium]